MNSNQLETQFKQNILLCLATPSKNSDVGNALSPLPRFHLPPTSQLPCISLQAERQYQYTRGGVYRSELKGSFRHAMQESWWLSILSTIQCLKRKIIIFYHQIMFPIDFTGNTPFRACLSSDFIPFTIHSAIHRKPNF